MKRYLYCMFILTIMVIPATSNANQSAQKLGVCLVDSLNGKERKELAKWIYFGMSAHSTIKPYSNISQKKLASMNKYVGTLITRLITEDCPKIAKKAINENGSSAFEYAFEIVGKVAMQELMTEPSVEKYLGAFEQYLDQDKFNQAFE